MFNITSNQDSTINFQRKYLQNSFAKRYIEPNQHKQVYSLGKQAEHLTSQQINSQNKFRSNTTTTDLGCENMVFGFERNAKKYMPQSPQKINNLPNEQTLAQNNLQSKEIHNSIQLSYSNLPQYNNTPSISQLSTQSSSNNYCYPQYNNQQCDIINRDKRVSSNYRPFNILEMKGFSDKKYKDNIIEDSYASSNHNCHSDHLNNQNTYEIQQNIKSHSQTCDPYQLHKEGQNQQLLQSTNSVGLHSQQLQNQFDNNKPQQIRFASQNRNSQINQHTEQKYDLINSNLNYISSSKTTENYQSNYIFNNQAGRINNFYNHNQLTQASQQPQTNLFIRPLNENQQNTACSESRNHSQNITDLSMQDNQSANRFIRNNIQSNTNLHSAQSRQQGESSSITNKNQLKLKIEEKQRELEHLKQTSSKYRQSSIEAYNQINQKLAMLEQTPKSNRFNSCSRLNTFLLNKFSTSAHQAPLNNQRNQIVKSQIPS